MKLLLASLVTMSLFAADNFESEKENTVKRLQASNAAPSVVRCIKKAQNMDELNACEKAPAVGHAKHI